MRRLNITVSLLLFPLLATTSTAVIAASHTLTQGDQEIIVETHLVIGNTRIHDPPRQRCEDAADHRV